MSVHRLDDPAAQRSVQQWYYACPHCGWCGKLRSTEQRAARDGLAHREVKLKAAAS